MIEPAPDRAASLCYGFIEQIDEGCPQRRPQYPHFLMVLEVPKERGPQRLRPDDRTEALRPPSISTAKREATCCAAQAMMRDAVLAGRRRPPPTKQAGANPAEARAGASPLLAIEDPHGRGPNMCSRTRFRKWPSGARGARTRSGNKRPSAPAARTHLQNRGEWKTSPSTAGGQNVLNSTCDDVERTFRGAARTRGKMPERSST